jgi:predicted DCC family thiol-disulfide oxidoreductase YuxK
MAERVDVVFDGQCGFCTRVLHTLERLDVAHAVRLYDSHDMHVIRTRFPMLAGADFDAAMFAVAGGRVYRGYFAFERLLREIPLCWPLLLLFKLPGAAVIGPRVYAWIARRRRSFGCGGGTCELPPGSSPPS